MCVCVCVSSYSHKTVFDTLSTAGPLPVYTPLNFPASDDVPNGDQCAAGGGGKMCARERKITVYLRAK